MQTVELIRRYSDLVLFGEVIEAMKECSPIEAELKKIPPLDEQEIWRWIEDTVKRLTPGIMLLYPNTLKYLSLVWACV